MDAPRSCASLPAVLIARVEAVDSLAIRNNIQVGCHQSVAFSHREVKRHV
jgi:hypothetical protein